MQIDAGVRLKGLAMLFYLVMAAGFSVLAVIQLSPSPPREAPDDWGSSAHHLRVWLAVGIPLVCFAISVVPNRWFVTVPFAFYSALLVTLAPVVHLLVLGFRHFALWRAPNSFLSLGMFLILLVLSALLPCSLIRAYGRYRSTGRAGYF